MDDVDFVLGQYEEGKGVLKKGLTLYSSYHRSNTFLSPCQTANDIRDLQLEIMSTTFLGRKRLKVLRCVGFCSQTGCRMILLGCEEPKQPVTVSENVSGSQMETGRSSTRLVEDIVKNSPEIPKFPSKPSAFQVPHKIKNATSIAIRKVKNITQQQVQCIIRQRLSRCRRWRHLKVQQFRAEGIELG